MNKNIIQMLNRSINYGIKMESSAPRVLVTGANGQIGTELVPALRNKYGFDNVIASDIEIPIGKGPFINLDVCNFESIKEITSKYEINWIFHLAALLSAKGEKNPKTAIKINNLGTENILEISKLNNIRVYIPSSIAAFGETTPKNNTPNITIQQPTTIYGITKVYVELLGEYYHKTYGVDFRSLRYPGIISNKAMPGGGTTDYAVEIYHDALLNRRYKCFLDKNTLLPMMYMNDCIKATIQLMEEDENMLSTRVYNVSGCSFTPEDQFKSIKKYIPEFEIKYEPDFRQFIAETWPNTIDDSFAKYDWNWEPSFKLDEMSIDMLQHLSIKYGININFESNQIKK